MLLCSSAKISGQTGVTDPEPTFEDLELPHASYSQRGGPEEKSEKHLVKVAVFWGGLSQTVCLARKSNRRFCFDQQEDQIEDNVFFSPRGRFEEINYFTISSI